MARASSQVVLLLGDGAAGMSLIDVDTLVRHELPVVMVMGNNGAWGLEKQPMQMLYGYDVVADPKDIGPSLDRAFASGVPYLVNILTDPEIPYPRATTGL